jgi:D-glycero-D-manno-heptose 1,7-bisphosphate phosphatase
MMHEPQNKVLFLDRDGVINVDHGYVYQSEKFEFIEGVFEACKAFADAGYKIIVVTNQSGIGRGYYTEDDFMVLTQWMKKQFSAHAVPISAVYFCPHHPKKALRKYLQQCDCRKPEPGMLLQGLNEHNADPAKSIMVGDKHSDMQAAIKAGITTRVLVKSGKSIDQNACQNACQSADYILNSIGELPQLLHDIN